MVAGIEATRTEILVWNSINANREEGLNLSFSRRSKRPRKQEIAEVGKGREGEENGRVSGPWE